MYETAAVCDPLNKIVKRIWPSYQDEEEQMSLFQIKCKVGARVVAFMSTTSASRRFKYCCKNDLGGDIRI